MSDDSALVDDQPDPATISSIGSNCIRCGEWVTAPDAASLPDAMAEHMVQQHYGPRPA